jgi:hypothetical protein
MGPNGSKPSHELCARLDLRQTHDAQTVIVNCVPRTKAPVFLKPPRPTIPVMRQAFFLATLLCMSRGAIANETYLLALPVRNLAAGAGGVSAAVTTHIYADNSRFPDTGRATYAIFAPAHELTIWRRSD